MKVAIIGCGKIGLDFHAPAYLKNSNAEIKYFCNTSIQKADAAVKRFNCGKAVRDYKEILEDPDLDAVSVCTPNTSHAQITIDFLNAGKSVLCEKPIAATFEDALKMQEAQRSSNKILAIALVNRYNNCVNLVKAYIESGKLGEVFHVYASFRDYRSIPGLGGAFTSREASGGGVLIDWGVHFLDAIMYCLNDPKPLTVSAETFCKLGKNINDYVYKNMWAGPPIKDGIYNVEDSVVGLIRTTGPVISFNGAWAQNIDHKEKYIDFMGDEGGIRFEFGNDFTFYTSEDEKLISYKPGFEKGNSFENEINAFVEAVENLIGGGDASLISDLPSDINTVIITSEIMQAIYDSAEIHKEVSLV
jgi:predicted dehydrogenase